MTCGDFRENLLDGERGCQDATAVEHVRDCEQCARALLNQRTLREGLKAIAGYERAMPAPSIEAQLLAYFGPPRRPRGRVSRWLVPALAGMMAAGLLLTRTAPHSHKPPALVAKMPPPPAPLESTRQIGMPAPLFSPRNAHRAKPAIGNLGTRAEPETPFMRIPYAAPLLPTEQIEIVRVNLPAAALASLGVSAEGPHPGTRVDADLVLGENGLARAVRLIRWDGSQ